MEIRELIDKMQLWYDEIPDRVPTGLKHDFAMRAA
jgi:hypothetical protein